MTFIPKEDDIAGSQGGEETSLPGDVSYAELFGKRVEMVSLIPDLLSRASSSRLSNEAFTIPDELQELSEQRVAALQAEGKHVTNGKALALTHISRVDDAYRFIYQPLYYFDHVGTNLSLDELLASGRTVRETYGDIATHNTIEGFNQSPYARLVGVTTVLVTSDDQVILQERSAKTAVVAGQMHVSMAEGMTENHVNERGEIDPQQTVLRGLRQELGHSKLDILFDLDSVRVDRVALGVSSQYLQPDFAVRAHVPVTAEEVIRMAEGGRGKWERVRLEAVPFTRDSLAEVTSQGVWSPHALFALSVASEGME